MTRLAAVEPEPASNPTLRAELISMRDTDQEARRRLIKDQKNEALKKEVTVIDARNVARLREILKTNGWPGKALVGTDGAGAAWPVPQHVGAPFLPRTAPP